MQGCDVAAVRGNEPLVVVELKRAFGISLVLQGVNRLKITDNFYFAVGAFPNDIAAYRHAGAGEAGALLLPAPCVGRCYYRTC